MIDERSSTHVHPHPPRRAALGLAAAATSSLILPRFAVAQGDNRPSITIAVQRITNSNTLDVLREQSNVGERVFFSHLREGPIGRHRLGGLKQIPLLATSWKRIDDHTVELELRRGVKFHDGSELTAEGVVFTFSRERMFADTEAENRTLEAFETIPTPRPGKELPVEVPSVARRTWPDLIRVDAVGSHTVRFVNATPDVTLEGRLSGYGSENMSRKGREESASCLDWARRPVTTGPYEVVEFKPDTHLILEAHDEYWGGRPPLKRIEAGVSSRSPGRSRIRAIRHRAAPSRRAVSMPIADARATSRRSSRSGRAVAWPVSSPSIGAERSRRVPDPISRPRRSSRHDRTARPGRRRRPHLSHPSRPVRPSGRGRRRRRRLLHAGTRRDARHRRRIRLGQIDHRPSRPRARTERPRHRRLRRGDPAEGRNGGTADWRRLRARIQMIFQDPLGALDRRLPIGDQIREPLDIHAVGDRSGRLDRVADLLARVGLTGDQGRRHPHELSGGQRQRAVLARALATTPDFLVCDEPISALDVSIQTQVVNLLVDLQAEFGLAMPFVGHDLRVVRRVSRRVAVMYLGRVVEEGAADDLFATPVHPHTQALVSAAPIPGRRLTDRIVLQGDPPDPADRPSGCAFHPRCPVAEARCRVETPRLVEVGGGRRAACLPVSTDATPTREAA